MYPARVVVLFNELFYARIATDGFLESAPSTADPHLQALAWNLKARVAMAESG
jgi:hypothetical protein